MPSIGENIRKIRIEKGLTQKQLGDLCGMVDTAIGRYERGKANPKIETIQKIADALNVSIDLIQGKIKIDHFDVDTLRRYPELEDYITDLTSNFIEKEFDYENWDYSKKAKILNILMHHVVWDPEQREIELYPALPYENTILEQLLLSHFEKLNALGKSEALDRIEELTQIKKYTEPDKDQ